VIGRAVGPLRQWFSRRIVSRRALGLALLLVSLATAAAGVASRIRGIESALLVISAAAGLLLAWALAATILRARTAALLSLAAGVGGVLGRVGRLGVHVEALLRALGGAWWSVFQVLLGVGEGSASAEGVPGLFDPMLSALGDLVSDALTLLARVADWALGVAAGESTFDPVSATVVWSLALWVVAAWAGWMLRRHDRPLAGLAPAAALIAGVLSSGEGGLWYVLALLAAMFLLLALTTYDQKVRRWHGEGVDYPDLRVEVAAVSIGLTIALVAVSAGAASIDMERIREALERRSGETAGGAGSTSGAQAGSGTERERPSFRAGVSGLARTHMLGAGPVILGQAVMRVGVGATGAGESAPHYWRHVTYDRYTGLGWFASKSEVVEYAAGELLGAEPPRSARIVRQEVEILTDVEEALFAAGSLVVADHEYRVDWRPNQDQFGAAIGASTYVAESFVSAASEEDLRSAGENYPDWVAERYLALPDSVPDRVFALARDLTATEPTPYDRASAIEDYLRGYQYSLDVPLPPRDRDVVDYFLFDLERGYCDYHATAMAVLARAAGVPARLAVGYTTGAFDGTTGRFLVRDSNAHAWVEVYFPGHGWVEFEPTAGFGLIDRAAAAAAGAEDEPEEGLGIAAVLRLLAALPLESIAVGALGAALLLGLVWLAVDELHLRRVRPAAAAAMLYRRLRRQAMGLSVPMRAGDTAYEFAASFSEWLATRKGRRRQRVLEPVAAQVVALARFYVRASYGPRLPSSSERKRALRSWRGLRWRLWMTRVRRIRVRQL